MRSKPWQDVLSAIKQEGEGAKLGSMGEFEPITDDKVVFSDYKARSTTGKFIKRPMLVGNNANELSLFAVILNQQSLLKSPMLTTANSVFACPSSSAAKARSDNKVKVWRYLYAGEWPNMSLGPDAGAWHGSEIGMVFGSILWQQEFYSEMIKEKIRYPHTEAQKKLESIMMTSWTNFAKDPELGLEKMGWPTYDESSTCTYISCNPFATANQNIRANHRQTRRNKFFCH